MYSELEYRVIRDIMPWSIVNEAHNNYKSFEDVIKAYWKEMLNTNANVDSMWCDSASVPITDWDFSGPQPEVVSWDSN